MEMQDQLADTQQNEKYLQVASRFLQIFRYTYWLCMFRLIFIGLIFYSQDFFITIQNGFAQPWSLMCFFVSGSVEMINAIGYGSAIQFLKCDCKILKQNNNRPLRIGKKEAYDSIYSALIAYKYVNRNFVSAFQVTKMLHYFATFLILGQMALMIQNQVREGFIKQFYLWVFIMSAYIYNWEMNYTIIESSKGLKLKIRQFHSTKIKEIWRLFMQWRKNYNKYLTVITALFIATLVYQILSYVLPLQPIGYFQSQTFTILLIFSNLTSIVVIFINNSLIKKSQQSLNLQLLSTKISQNMHQIDNLTLLGILNRYLTPKHRTLFILHRILWVLCFMAWLRSSGNSWVFLFIFFIIFHMLFVVESSKFEKAIKSKINYLNVLKYQEILNFVDVQQVQDFDKQLKDEHISSTVQNQTKGKITVSMQACSVCLLQYSASDQVVIVPCGHVFHQICLSDWFKQKRECPLCRLQLPEYTH